MRHTSLRLGADGGGLVEIAVDLDAEFQGRVGEFLSFWVVVQGKMTLGRWGKVVVRLWLETA